MSATATVLRELKGGRLVTIAGHRVRLAEDCDGGEVIAEVRHPKGCRPTKCHLLGSIEKHSMFHGPQPVLEIVSETMPEKVPSVMYGLGECVAVIYRSAKWDGKAKDYVHEFEGNRPQLCGDRDDQLWLVGGGYTVTAEGIEG